VPATTALRPRKQPRQARSRLTLAAILTAAAQVFERRGYAGGTTDAIAERAGVSVGSLYQYFPNKDAILVALMERHVEEGTALLTGLAQEVRGKPLPIDVLLHRFVDAMIELHNREPHLHRVLFENAPLPGSMRHDLERLENAFVEEVGGLLSDHPGLTLHDPVLAATMLVRAVDGLIHGFILRPPPELDADTFADEVVCMLSRYLERCGPVA
jgi:AcrR family transcriptional regulator